jgi:hypothetical protein
MLQDMYQSEATAELPPSSDSSIEQLVKPKCSDGIAIMPRVLKVDMAPAKLPLPNKTGTRKMVDAHFRAAGGDMEGLGHIRKVCFTSRQKTGVHIWIDCDRDIMHRFWIGHARKLAGDTGKCEEMPKEWVQRQLQKDTELAEQSEKFARRYAERSMLAVASLSSMLSERAPSEVRKRKENNLHVVLVESNVVSKKYVRASTGERIEEAVKAQEAEDEDDSE